MVDELTMIDQPVSDEDITLHIINGLGCEYKEFTASIRAHDVPFSSNNCFDRWVAQKEYLKREETHNEVLIPIVNFT